MHHAKMIANGGIERNLAPSCSEVNATGCAGDGRHACCGVSDGCHT